jgi:small-conductance mechanosensitive channel
MHTRLVPRHGAGLVCAAVLLAAAAPRAADESGPAVVRFHNRDIATLRATLGPLSPRDRVDAATRRLSRVTASDARKPVTVVPFGEARSLLVGDRVIVAIVADDLDPSAGETLDGAAEEAAENLRAALASWSDQRRPEVVTRGVIRVLVATGAACLAFLALRALRRFLLRLLASRAERRFEKRPVTVLGHDVRGATVRGLRAVMLAYGWLAYALEQFPFTEPWGEGLAGFLLGTLQMIGAGIIRAVPDVVVVVLVFFVTRFFVQLATKLFDAVERGRVTLRGIHPDTADATRRIVTALIWIFGVVVAYPFIPGSSSEAFKGISVLLGLMISLGSSGVINQAMSGMMVVFSRALKAGEYVFVAEYEGTVTEVGALSTKLRTPRDEEINIPNALLVASVTRNYSRLAGDHGVAVFSSVGIGYDAPWRTVHRLLKDAAAGTPGIRREPAPFVRQSALTSFCVDYTINAYLERPESRFEVLSNLNANILDAFNAAGIQIMTPAFESQPPEPVLVPKAQWDVGAEPPGSREAGRPE